MLIKKTILIDLDGVLNEYIGDYVPNYIPPLKTDASDLKKKKYLANMI